MTSFKAMMFERLRGDSALPLTFLEFFLPGFGAVQQFFSYFGLDVTALVSIGVLVLAMIKATQYFFYRVFLHYFASSVSIDSGDELYFMMMGWLAEQEMIKRCRSLHAVTLPDPATAGIGEDHTYGQGDENSQETGWTLFCRRRLPLRYEPSFGEHFLWHAGRPLRFDRSTRRSGWGSTQDEAEILTITCIGRSTRAIKELLAEVRARVLQSQRAKTKIWRPRRKIGGLPGGLWTRPLTLRSRPLDSVVLDETQKSKIIEDVEEYLQPSTAEWYASRGVPYRRGYLFHGPPGTGKTSMAYSLAGTFGLDVYFIPLSSLGDDDLPVLFASLPQPCMVLLEDIDDARLKRDMTESGVPTNDNTSRPSSGISMATLLNVIDGVGSSEGRVLVITTNYLDRLDAALTRPGRIDMRAEFALASPSQIAKLFLRMYQAPESTQTSPQKDLEQHNKVEISAEQLHQLSQDFAAVWTRQLSPAAVQGYLLMHKSDPHLALENAPKWIQEHADDA